MNSIKNMMQRVGNGVSKAAAANTFNAYKAVMKADLNEPGKVIMDPHDYATVQNYLEACARKAGVIAIALAIAGCSNIVSRDGDRQGRVIRIENLTRHADLVNQYFLTLEVACNTTAQIHSNRYIEVGKIVCFRYSADRQSNTLIACPPNLKPFPRFIPYRVPQIAIYDTSTAAPSRCREVY